MPNYTFPPAFRFGIADADLQVIGERHCTESERSCESMWRWFAQQSGKCHQNQSPDDGVDRFHRWEDDLGLIEELGTRDYRTSISMCRTLNEDGSPNKTGLKWYREYFQAIRTKGIQISATLYHWELPQYLSAQGGWKSKKAVEALVRHAAVVHEELGEYIHEYFILNEPWCSSFLSYHLGIHAPGETDIASALTAAHHLLLSQGLVLRELLARGASRVSTVYNVQTAYAATASEADLRAMRMADQYFNRWFLEPTFLGTYPEEMLEYLGERAPKFPKSDLETICIGDNLHALGLNYYRGDVVRADPKSEMGFGSIDYAGWPTNDLGWPIFSGSYRGLYDILQQIYFSYCRHGLRRLYVTENGMALREPLNDTRRIEYYRSHLLEVLDAIERGVPLEAFFFWTLMDNYEWAEGYRPDSCFGLVHVDRKTLTRTRKASFDWAARLIKTKLVPMASGASYQPSELA